MLAGRETMLDDLELMGTLYLLYSYKSANTDAEGCMCTEILEEEDPDAHHAWKVLSLLALLGQKYKY
jgi:phytoene/squalene synthetase